MSAPALPAIAALTFHANRHAERFLVELGRGRRAGIPLSRAAEDARAVARRAEARTPTHRTRTHRLQEGPAMDTLTTTQTCHYCGLPTSDGADLHPICALEVSDEPLMAPLHSCPDSGTYPCEICNPGEEIR